MRSWREARRLLCAAGAGVLLLAGLQAGRQAAVCAEKDARAEALYNDALGMDPQQPDERARVLMEAIQQAPGETRYHIALGDTYAFSLSDGEREADPRRTERLNRARKAYLEASRSDPASPIPSMRLASLEWAAGDPKSAAAHLDRAIALDRENALPMYERALLHFLAREDAQGRQSLLEARSRKVVRFEPMLPTRPMVVREASACVAVIMSGVMPHFSHLRELERQVVRVAEEMKKEDALANARALLIEAQRAASRTIFAEPPTLMCVLVGVAMDSIVCASGLQPLAARMADANTLQRLALRNEARNKLRDGARALSDRASNLAANPLALLTVLKDEGDMVRKLLQQSGWVETVDDTN
ncbi:MAG: hypothetical protein QHJ73_15575 [Armatimonadota bacterium]|nr:hypothetical protein [Armatimonadota bacterium]